MMFKYLLSWGGGGVLNASTERAEGIQIIITFAQEADNVIPYQVEWLVSMLGHTATRVIETVSNIRISRIFVLT